MTRNDIINLAWKVGYPLVEYDGEPYIPPLLTVLLEATVSEEREACAKLCEQMDHDGVMIAADCAEAIRARAKQ